MTVQIVPLLQHITISDIKNKDTQYNDNTIMVLSQLDMGEYDPYDNTFQHDLRMTMRDQFVLSSMLNKKLSLRRVRWWDNFFREGVLSYLGSDVELQARLHTLIAHRAKR